MTGKTPCLQRIEVNSVLLPRKVEESSVLGQCKAWFDRQTRIHKFTDISLEPDLNTVQGYGGSQFVAIMCCIEAAGRR